MGAATQPALIVTGGNDMAPVLDAWAGDYAKRRPQVEVRVQAAGPEMAAAALADHALDLAAMERPMTAAEIDAFQVRNGFRPTAVKVAMDAVVIIVNALNPVGGLTLQQVDAIFSVTRRCGGSQDIDRWGQLQPLGIWHSRPLQLFGLDVQSGARRYLREQALCGGEFKPAVTARAGPRDVTAAVRDSANAIGYVPMAFVGEGVRSVPLAVGSDARFVEATADNVLRGLYPLGRYLYLYAAQPPGRALPAAAAGFLSGALSLQGQRRVAENGYVPLPSVVTAQELAKLH